MNYWRNLRLWVKGFRWLWTRRERRDGEVLQSAHRILEVGSRIWYKPGWGPWTFLPVYLFNIGTRVLFGGAVMTWSRWFWETRYTYRLSAFANRLLNHADENHGAESGTVLWGSQETSWAATGALVFWGLVLGGVIWLLGLAFL